MAYRIKSPVERRMSVMCQRQGGLPQMRGVAYGHDVVGPVLVRLLSPYSWNMISNKIKPKANLRLRKVGKQYMIVESCADNVNMSNVFSLNKTAARLWDRIEQADVTTSTPSLLIVTLSVSCPSGGHSGCWNDSFVPPSA